MKILGWFRERFNRDFLRGRFALLVFLFLLLGVFGWYRLRPYFSWNPQRQEKVQIDDRDDGEDVVTADPLLQEWNDLRADGRFQKCYQSQKDMNKLVNDIEPEYKQTLNKETNGGKLTIQDRYVRYIYGLWQARARDYSIFDNFNNVVPPKENLDSMRNLLDYIYCPNMSNVSSKYPASVGSCQEAVQAWMNPFEIPMPQGFKFPEEYELAKKKFKEGLANSAISAKSCCLPTGDAGSSGTCAYIKQFMK